MVLFISDILSYTGSLYIELSLYYKSVAAISCSEWGGRNRPSSFGHSSGERKLATVA